MFSQKQSFCFIDTVLYGKYYLKHQNNIKKTAKGLNSMLQRDNRDAEIIIADPSGRMYTHSVKECSEDMKWQEAKMLKMEKGEKQRKVKESIETYKMEIKQKNVLNICDHLDMKWKRVIKKKFSR